MSFAKVKSVNAMFFQLKIPHAIFGVRFFVNIRIYIIDFCISMCYNVGAKY